MSVTYEPNWLNVGNVCHLDIEAIAPAKAALPFTDTGYRSYFSNEQIIAEAGGPVAFVRAWLYAAAQSKEWKAAEAASRQLNLL